ncbi:hypothetical protein TheetDRAFT_3304, partial [Thermoanaerobacter ethanolicus JW 200]
SGIIIPLFFLLFTYGGSGQLRIGVVNRDKSQISTDLINSLEKRINSRLFSERK